MKGICFVEPLFHAAVKGRKTQHRMIMTLQPDENGYVYPKGHPEVDKISIYDIPALAAYRVGETVYLKEPYCMYDGRIGDNGEAACDVAYKYDKDMPANRYKWSNKIFMPEKYARYFIEITGVRCERLQDISDEDCFKEGILYDTSYPDEFYNPIPLKTKIGEFYQPFDTPRETYAVLIDRISRKDTLERNPWVWVYDFKLVK